MTYELAKKLKDAGFSQIGYCENFIAKDSDGNENGYEVLKVPTLSELIEACGDKFGKLQRIKLGEMVNWNAFESHPQTILISMAYSTPEEAVVNLWLALKEKRTQRAKPPQK